MRKHFTIFNFTTPHLAERRPPRIWNTEKLDPCFHRWKHWLYLSCARQRGDRGPAINQSPASIIIVLRVIYCSHFFGCPVATGWWLVTAELRMFIYKMFQQIKSKFNWRLVNYLSTILHTSILKIIVFCIWEMSLVFRFISVSLSRNSDRSFGKDVLMYNPVVLFIGCSFGFVSLQVIFL